MYDHDPAEALRRLRSAAAAEPVTRLQLLSAHLLASLENAAALCAAVKDAEAPCTCGADPELAPYDCDVCSLKYEAAGMRYTVEVFAGIVGGVVSHNARGLSEAAAARLAAEWQEPDDESDPEPSFVVTSPR